jgi:hypothetical protein
VPATRKNRLNNPLRKLRLILGDGKTPLGQIEFASRTGLSVATLRAIEGGRRPFSAQCQKQILAMLSATWNPRKGQWCLLWSTEPYKREYADFSRYLDPDDRYLDDLNVHMLIERLLSLFSHCHGGQQRFALLIYLSAHLKETAKEFGLKINFNPTEPLWHRGHDLKMHGKQLRDLVIFPVYKNLKFFQLTPDQDAGGIFDFRAHRTFRAADYPGLSPTEYETWQQMVQMAQMTTDDRQSEPEKNEILSAPIAHPNMDRDKKGSSEKVSKEP